MRITSTPSNSRLDHSATGKRLHLRQVWFPVLGILGWWSQGVAEASSIPLVLSDSYVLQSQAPTSTGSWSYDSGNSAVASWGTFAGSDPVQGGLDLITGSANAVIVPPICDPTGLLGCTDPVYGDTRDGAAITFSTSGQIGVDVYAQASAGSVTATLPSTAQLTFDSSQAGLLQVSGSSTIAANAQITATAPSFKAGVNGIINLDNSVTAEGCSLGFGCDSTNPVSLDVNAGKFPLVGFDTTQHDPLSVFGIGVPLFSFGQQYEYRAGQPPCQGPATAEGVGPICDSSAFGTPRLGTFKLNSLQNVTGGTVSGDVVTVSQNQPVATLNADLAGIAQFALDFPVDVLNPKLSLGSISILGHNVSLGSISGSLFDVQAGVVLGDTESYSLAPSEQVTLDFDKPVTEQIKKCLDPSNCFYVPVTSNQITVPLDGQVVNLTYTGDAPSVLDRTYSVVSAPLTNDVSLTLNPDLPILAGCIQFSLLGVNTGLNCIYDNNFQPDPPLGTFLISSDVTDLGPSFTSATFSSGGGGPGPVPTPEPSTLCLLGLGLARAAFSRDGRCRIRSFRRAR